MGPVLTQTANHNPPLKVTYNATIRDIVDAGVVKEVPVGGVAPVMAQCLT